MKFIAGNKELRIELEGLEKLWALKGSLTIPKSQILEVDFKPVKPVMQDFWGYLRLPGTSLPWFFVAGTFRGRGKKEFLFVRIKQPGLLVITLKPGAEYDRIRLTCKPEIALGLADWWRGKIRT